MPGWVFFNGDYVFYSDGRVSYQLSDVEANASRTLTVEEEDRTVTVEEEDRTVVA